MNTRASSRCLSIIVLGCAALLTLSASISAYGRGADDVLHEYLQLEVGGAWLTAEGKEALQRVAAVPFPPNREIVTHVITSYSVARREVKGNDVLATVQYEVIGSIENFSNFTPAKRISTIEVKLHQVNGAWKVVATELAPYMSWRVVVAQRGARWKETIKAIMDATYEAHNPVPEKAEAVQRVIRTFCELDAQGMRKTAQSLQRFAPYITWTNESSSNRLIVISGYDIGGPVIEGDTAVVPVYYKVLGEWDGSQLVEDKYDEAILFGLVKTETGWKIDKPRTLRPHVLTNEEYTKKVVPRSAESPPPGFVLYIGRALLTFLWLFLSASITSVYLGVMMAMRGARYAGPQLSFRRHMWIVAAAALIALLPNVYLHAIIHGLSPIQLQLDLSSVGLDFYVLWGLSVSVFIFGLSVATKKMERLGSEKYFRRAILFGLVGVVIIDLWRLVQILSGA